MDSSKELEHDLRDARVGLLSALRHFRETQDREREAKLALDDAKAALGLTPGATFNVLDEVSTFQALREEHLAAFRAESARLRAQVQVRIEQAAWDYQLTRLRLLELEAGAKGEA